MAIVYEKSALLTDTPLTFCPGCTHGIVHKLVAETLVELDVADRTIGVSPVGCAVMAYKFLDIDMIQAAHGRAPAVATGLIRSVPDAVVFTYQGDGDLAAIGTAESVHAAMRGENIVVIFVNNAIYGMTSGQMAPTTLPEQVTQTSPGGRSIKSAGHPIRVCEMLSTLDGVHYAERVSLHSVPHIRKAKAAIKRAFQNQIDGKGFSIVEVLSTCPTNWGLSPVDSLKWVSDKLARHYPVGVYKDCDKEEAADERA